jgi:hypothetical protein
MQILTAESLEAVEDLPKITRLDVTNVRHEVRDLETS